MNYTSRFDGRGEIYAKARLKYAAEFFDYLKNTMHIPAGSVLRTSVRGRGFSQSSCCTAAMRFTPWSRTTICGGKRRKN